jgi:spore maturation protein SpmB
MDLFLASSDNGMYGFFGSGFSVFTSLLGYVIAGLCMMGMFKKAGKPQWAAFVPIYNWIVLLEIIGRPVWWVILLIIPCVNIIAWIILALDIAKSYGQSQGFGIALGVGIIFPIITLVCLVMLSYGPAQYTGPAAAQTAA